jgi:hypothetical protein
MARRPKNADQRQPAAAESIDALSFGALRSLAENPEASPQTLALLSHDPLLDVRVAVAWNARTPASALARLAEGPVEVQAGVAQNVATSPAILDRLSAHPEAIVRSATATNPRLPLPLFYTLAQDRDPVVRRHVARNPQVPYGVLTTLARDPDPEVRRTAKDGVRRWGELAG